MAKNLPNHDGILSQTKSRKTGATIQIYIADTQGIDTRGPKYAIVCEEHGSIWGANSIATAKIRGAHSDDWCDGCREVLYTS